MFPALFVIIILPFEAEFCVFAVFIIPEISTLSPLFVISILPLSAVIAPEISKILLKSLL